ncbi:unnamed protein product [Gordionus sp. m RMFG-2023]|uniref:small ribosomal subunit protein uS5m-like n=1 Tax=Gordionus sp. m RMFG-2023 TaxID=3053472 RepID=UPI0030E4E17B
MLSLFDKFCRLNLYNNFIINDTITLHKFIHSTNIINDNIFTRISASELWKGVTSVSPAGKKRGRGKGKNRKIVRDLNKGQILGFGKKNMLWPGLNAPVLEQGRQMLKIKSLPPDPDREKRMHELRDKIYKFKPLKLSNMDKGWSGGIMAGRRLGPPDALTHGNYSEEYDENEKEEILATEKTEHGFDSKVLKLRIVCHMTGNMGRKRNFSCIVITGNKKGLIGWAFSRSPEAKVALRKAKNKAFKHLIFVERHDDRTIYHTLYGKEFGTKVHIFRAPPGHGIIAHRVIKTICEMVGIKDLYAKVEGSVKNYHNLTRCAIQMLAKQETYQQLADRTGYNIVEFSPETEFLPTVLAAPKDATIVNPAQKPPSFEDLYTDGGKLFKARRKPDPLFKDLPSYAKYLELSDRFRNMEELRVKMEAEKDITGLPPHPLTEADMVKSIKTEEEVEA